ncbi:hypothetical protein [Mucilaginibacter sp. MD40]|uniref:hypothetical protein n=1 Tax=Mucilaginibacter sp. MD40 TaxID=2029590 RepID=UPI0013040BB7|nr:hypothetical protein [Mucilaginibacter sp. MD40]
MEMGYSSLDLFMLLIAAVVIWAASRTPIKKNDAEARVQEPGLNSGQQHFHSL